MKVLMINSTQSGLNVEFFDGKKLSQENSFSNKHSENILLSIDKLLKGASVKPKEVDVVAVCVGPGSFTGIRVAISVAKAFAVANEAKIISFTTFDLFSYNELDADAVVVKGFSEFNYLKTNGEQDCFDEETLKTKLATKKKIVIEKEVAENLGIKNYVLPNEKMWGLVSSKIERQEFVSLTNFEALYLRQSQAERTREGKK